MSFAFATPHRRRRPSLTPMIDVVFLLLVFFMLVARFGGEGAVPIARGGASGSYDGPPRLVEVRPDGLTLNGQPTTPDALIDSLSRLAPAPDDAVILRPRDGVTLQDLVVVMEQIQAAGHSRIVLVE